jgi:potassium-transporting ATPase KdpC subunit
MRQTVQGLRLLLILTILTGFVYPLLVTVLGNVLFPQKASGEFIKKGEQTVGARLIAQNFVADRYFWGRPSAIDFNPMASGGSNLGPTSETLKKAVIERGQRIGKTGEGPVPSELLFASGSGLDPEISPETAIYQVNRIAKARGWEDKQKIASLITSRVKPPDFFILGQSRVNVLELNLALDEMDHRGKLR